MCDLGQLLMLRLRSRSQPLSKYSFETLRCRFLSLGAGMRRREFLGILAGTAAGWPLAAHAQQAERMRRIGVLMGLAANDPEGQVLITRWLQALQQLGWIEGRNLQVDIRWGGGNAEDTRKYAAELVALVPDVILAPASAPVGPLLQATRTI